MDTVVQNSEPVHCLAASCCWEASPLPRRKRADRRTEIVTLLRQSDTLSRAEIAEKLGISAETANRWLARLRGDRIVEMTTPNPRDPKARYRLTARASSRTSSRASQ